MKLKIAVLGVLALGVVLMGAYLKPALACGGSCDKPTTAPPPAPKPDEEPSA